MIAGVLPHVPPARQSRPGGELGHRRVPARRRHHRHQDDPAAPGVALHAGNVPELVNRSFGITVTFAQPGIAERAMYFGTPLLNGGHASAGATAPSTSWLLAEGATGRFSTTFLLLANPGAVPGQVTVTYLTDAGRHVTKTYTIGAKQRLTINVALEDPSLAHVAVGAQVSATVPVIAERAQYWPGPPDRWYRGRTEVSEPRSCGIPQVLSVRLAGVSVRDSPRSREAGRYESHPLRMEVREAPIFDDLSQCRGFSRSIIDRSRWCRRTESAPARPASAPRGCD